MANTQFDTVAIKVPGRNHFDLSHALRITSGFGMMLPVLTIPCIPGDLHNISISNLGRMAPMVTPMMERVDRIFETWFVPERILWDKSSEFITGGEEGSTPPAKPYFVFDLAFWNAHKRLADAFGLVEPAPGTSHNLQALPFGCYQKIFIDRYRDQNLQKLNTQWIGKLTDGDNSAAAHLFDLQYCSWKHDPFTAALPWAQKGEPVTIPIGPFEDVMVKATQSYGPPADTDLELAAGGSYQPSGTPAFTLIPTDTPTVPMSSPLFADTSEITATEATLNDLRTAEAIQRFLENSAKLGTRYEEYLRRFGVKIQDSRLQRPEFVGGFKQTWSISEIVQTSETSDTSPQGNLAGHGVIGIDGRETQRYFVQEHGYLITIMRDVPMPSYQQGINKDWFKINDKYEYMIPEMAQLGEDEVKIRELYLQASDPTLLFGYQRRYYEYCYMSGRTCGLFKDDLAHWTMTRIFSAEPALNATFIKCVPTDRIWAVPAEADDSLLSHIHFKVHSMRPIPKFNVPVLS